MVFRLIETKKAKAGGLLAPTYYCKKKRMNVLQVKIISISASKRKVYMFNTEQIKFY